MADPQDLRERAVGALLAVVALALVIGGVIGAVAYGAVRVAGIGDDASPASAESTPSGSGAGGGASPSASASPQPQATSSPASGQHAQSKPTPRHRHHHRGHHHRTRAGAPSLSAAPGRVSPMGRIDMSGRYPGHAGATLQVQQRVGSGHWQDFPVTVTVRGGGFHTWIASGRRGLNRFRVLDRGSGRASAPVSVMVG